MSKKHLVFALLLAACSESATKQVPVPLANCREPGVISNAFAVSLTYAARRSSKMMTVFSFKNVETTPRSIYDKSATDGIEHISFMLISDQGVQYNQDQVAELPIWVSQPVNPGRNIDIPLEFFAPKGAYTFTILRDGTRFYSCLLSL